MQEKIHILTFSKDVPFGEFVKRKESQTDTLKEYLSKKGLSIKEVEYVPFIAMIDNNDCGEEYLKYALFLLGSGEGIYKGYFWTEKKNVISSDEFIDKCREFLKKINKKFSKQIK
jgi:hypothetical protein